MIGQIKHFLNFESPLLVTGAKHFGLAGAMMEPLDLHQVFDFFHSHSFLE